MLKARKEKWLSEIPEKTEENPFPLHPDHAWRIEAFVGLVELLKNFLVANAEMAADEQVKSAMKSLDNTPMLRANLLRFYMVKDIDEDEDDSYHDCEEEEEKAPIPYPRGDPEFFMDEEGDDDVYEDALDELPDQQEYGDDEFEFEAEGLNLKDKSKSMLAL